MDFKNSQARKCKAYEHLWQLKKFVFILRAFNLFSNNIDCISRNVSNINSPGLNFHQHYQAALWHESSLYSFFGKGKLAHIMLVKWRTGKLY
jgi:hypothetical protein